MALVEPLKFKKSGASAIAFNEFEDGDQIPSSYVADLMGRNMLINCGVPVNQRSFAGGALAAGVYGYDRWKAGTGGCNVTVSAAGAWTHTSGTILQVVESPETAWGKPLTISVEDPSGSISVSVGGATGSITAGSGRRGVTLIPTGSGNMTVQLSATSVTYSRPQLERGSTASPFEVRPQQVELALCQRYFEFGNYFQTVYGSAGMQANTTIPFKVTKRAAPAMIVVSPSYSNASGANFFNTNPDSSCFQITVGSSGAGTVQAGWRADSEL